MLKNTNRGIPYKWGGFSTLTSFDNGIRNGACGGDVYNNNKLSGYGSYESDAVGVDCSGFVSRSWNLKGQKTTRNLPRISRELKKYENLKEGDILNKIGHVRLFKEFDVVNPTKRLKVYEASARDWKVNERSYRIKEDLQDEGYKSYTYFSLQDPGFSFADVEIVIDRSGSMSRKIEKAKEIAKYFIDSAKNNSRVGIVSFDGFGSADYPLTLISGANTAREEIKNAVDNAIPSTCSETFIGKGLETAREELNAVESGSFTKAIILISDGFESSAPFLPGYSTNDVLPELVADGIKVYAVKIGKQASSNPSLLSFADSVNYGNKFNNKTRPVVATPDYSSFSHIKAEEFLKDIADQTGGAYYNANNLEDFQQVYNSISTDLYKEKGTKLVSGTVPGMGDKTTVKTALIDPDIEEITFSLAWPGSDLDLVLIRPDGTEISSLVVNEYPNISFTSANTYEIYKVSQPMNGEWRLKIIGVNIPQEGENYTLAISGLSGMDFQTEFNQEEYFQNDPIKITASIIDQTLDIPEAQYIYGAEVEAKVENPEGDLLF